MPQATGHPPSDDPQEIGSGTQQTQQNQPPAPDQALNTTNNPNQTNLRPPQNHQQQQQQNIAEQSNALLTNNERNQLQCRENRNQDNSHQRNTTSKKKKHRANIHIATLNMKGRASQHLGHSNISKWSVVQHVMREKKIGILCLQETHLDNTHETQIENLYSRRLKIINSKDPTRPGSSAGVAFVINRELTNTENIKTLEIIPGRALALKIKWHNNETLTILNIYAPNNITQHPDFWKKINTRWQENNLPHPDFMLGDFNLTEDPLDRAPAKLDNENAISALRELRQNLNVQDTWREKHPTERLFTFYSNNNSHSRLDRIYTSPEHEENLLNWNSCTSAIPTDHRMISVRLAQMNTPFIGQGRWSWPLGLTNDPNLIQKMSDIGKKVQQQIIEQTWQRNEDSHPQQVWEEFKIQIRQEARKTAKEHLHKINQRTKKLEEDLKSTLENQDIDKNELTRRHKAWLESEINHLEKKRHKNMQLHSQAKWAAEGEKISKYWSKINSIK
ncbi:Endonuclease/exonuclease/phosphatase, partial [Suillus occidentalis]